MDSQSQVAANDFHTYVSSVPFLALQHELVSGGTTARRRLADNLNEMNITAQPTVRAYILATVITLPPPPPPVPTPPAPPPSPPSPPAPPPGLCKNTCDVQTWWPNYVAGVLYGEIGVCNDGGPSDPKPSAKTCATGTDCDDCGVRTFCVDCPEACMENNVHLDDMSLACMTDQWNDGHCDATCNDIACGYNDCSQTQIQLACLALLQAATTDYTTPPLAYGDRVAHQPNLVPVELLINLQPSRES